MQLKREDLQLRRQELANSRSRDQKADRHAKNTIIVAIVSVVVASLISAAAILASSYWSRNQLKTGQRQFVQTARSSEYNDIIVGLSSNSVAVQTNSIRRLVNFVKQSSNFDGDKHAQDVAFTDAIQTLQAFIKGESPSPVDGLQAITKPEPDVALRAMTQLRQLVEDPTFGRHSIDLAHTDLKGLTLEQFKPQASFYAPGTDFRTASLSGMQLTHTTTFTDSFFTCADLSASNLGRAVVGGADFTGANLQGANLEDVVGLSSPQVAHAEVDRDTKFPATDVSGKPFQRPTNPWLAAKGKCTAIVRSMTGMMPGEGYSPDTPCPSLLGSASTASAVCGERAKP